MRAPTILRTLPMRRLLPRAPTAVAPLREKTRFDRELAEELDSLQSRGDFGLAPWLDAAITTQKIASDSLVTVCCKDYADLGAAVDKHLEDNVEILDACNYFMDKMEHINKYVNLLRVVLHLVDKGAAEKPITRALELLDSCQGMEKRCKSMENRGSCLKKMLRQKLCHQNELSEVMCGSKTMALMCCRFLDLGLSFDPKRGLPMMKLSQPTSSSWLRLFEELAQQAEKKRVQRRRCWSSLLMQTVAAARELKEQMKAKREKEMKYAVERLKISCRELEHGLEIVQERVKNLYKSLIDVRMTLLGILSQPTNTVFISYYNS
ncbi:hypothetical protein VNO78_20237 [Psophocarpus tetragonolobus]|uniref:Uncharacterized protein n=1 Tax=Psophocarpus tetragonolobus TaxID=3891 RepID=A0AAN9SAJ4_PSOTE